MHITLFLAFPAITKIVKKTWAIEASPFYKVSDVKLKFKKEPESFLIYPHTGDYHTLLFPGTEEQIRFQSLQTETSGITIFGSVINIFLGQSVFIGGDLSIVTKLEAQDWQKGEEGNYAFWDIIRKDKP